MKKYAKTVSVILSVILLFSIIYIVPYASEIQSGDFRFTENDDGTLTLKKYNGNGGEVEVPIKVGDKNVTAIGNEAFAEYYYDTPDEVRITKITLPITVKTIGKSAFLDCTMLSDISMIGVGSIGESAFWNCKGLKRIAVSSELVEIGKNAFGGSCPTFKVYCERGSVAEEYALSNSLPCAALYPEKIILSSKSVSIEKNKSVKLKAEVTPSDVYYDDVLWLCNTDALSVSQTGKITGKAPGKGKVTCMAILGQAKAECSVTVKTPSVKTFAAEEVGLSYLKLSWSKATDSKGYRLEMKKDGSWTKIVDTTKRSYSLNGLAPGTEYEFRVRSYTNKNNVKYNSDWTVLSVSTDGIGTVKNIKAKFYSSDSLSFSWSKAANASGYIVYALGTDGKYKKIGETTRTSFTEKVKSGTIRKYKIRAFTVVDGKKYYGSYCKAFTFSSMPSKVSKLNVSLKTKNSIKLKWKSVENASGYDVFRVKNGEYILVKSVSTTKCEITGLKSNSKYSYAVRAYINTSLKTTYGSYSKTLTVTTEPAVTLKQTVADDLNHAFENIATASEVYVTGERKTTVNVISCSGKSKDKSVASAYAALFSSQTKEEFDFSNGKDKDGNILSDIFIPTDGFSITESGIKTVAKEKDGSGIRIKIMLKSETVSDDEIPQVNAHVWGMIDQNVIAEAISEDAILKSFTVTYSGTELEVKLNQNGTFDTFSLTVPFEIKTICKVGSRDVETVFSGKIKRNYTLTWW